MPNLPSELPVPRLSKIRTATPCGASSHPSWEKTVAASFSEPWTSTTAGWGPRPVGEDQPAAELGVPAAELRGLFAEGQALGPLLLPALAPDQGAVA